MRVRLGLIVQTISLPPLIVEFRLIVGVVPSKVKVLALVPIVTFVGKFEPVPADLPFKVRVFKVSADGTLLMVYVPAASAAVVSAKNWTVASVADTGTPLASQLVEVVQGRVPAVTCVHVYVVAAARPNGAPPSRQTSARSSAEEKPET